MKNILLKSLVIFVAMSLLNAQCAEWTVKLLKLPGGSYGMFSILILIFCSIITAIGWVMVLIFKKSYHSIVRIAALFEVIYLAFFIILGDNPFLYFSDATNENLLEILMYVNSFVVFLIMFLFDLIYSKAILSKVEKLP